jgi:hypothetical protein
MTATRTAIRTPRRSSLPRPRRAAALAIGVLVSSIALPAVPALGQQVMTMTVGAPRGAFGGGGRPAMNQRELDDYSDILTLDKDQRDAAKELLTSYTAEYEKASKEQAEKMRKIAEEFRETQDDEVWQQMGPAGEKFSKRTAELEKTLLSDIKTLCSEAQLAHWPKMERTRRRDQTIDRGSVSGESVDLVRIVKGLKLPGPALTEIAPQLDAYEQDLDRVLEARNKVFEEQAKAFSPGKGPMSFDLEAFQKNAQEAREAGEKVRDVNQRYARAIEGMLPETSKGEFAIQVKRSSFPMVYRQTRTERAFDAALKFEDLEAKQRESIAALHESFKQEIGSLNDKWAAAVVEEEKSGQGAIGVGGAVLMLRMGDDEAKSPTDVAKKARRDADKKAMESLESLLSDSQKERLPKIGDDGTPAVGGFSTTEKRVISTPR